MFGPRPTRASILVVEDDAELARMLIEALEDVGYRVWHAVDGQDARAQFDRARPDLILMDLMLPDIDGLVLCSLLKSTADVPIMICTGSVRRSDPILALKLGADDYIRKPVELEDLFARIEAVLRRTARRPAHGPLPSVGRNELRIGDLVMEPASRRAQLGSETLALTPTEFRLLSALTAHPETTLTRDQLARQVWGYADASNGRTIDVHIRRLRLKLAGHHGRAPVIVSVRGMGYLITRDEAAISAA